jgi:predicted transcriptional regulator
MNTVTLSIGGREKINSRALAALGGEQQGAHITFESLDVLWSTMTKKRWELLQAMCGQGGLTYRRLAELVGRDVKAVHTDVGALILAGLVEKSADGGIVFPYDRIHVDFWMQTPSAA